MITGFYLELGDESDEHIKQMGFDHHVMVQWEFQDPKMEVLYHIRPYFVGKSPYIGLT